MSRASRSAQSSLSMGTCAWPSSSSLLLFPGNPQHSFGTKNDKGEEIMINLAGKFGIVDLNFRSRKICKG